MNVSSSAPVQCSLYTGGVSCIPTAQLTLLAPGARYRLAAIRQANWVSSILISHVLIYINGLLDPNIYLVSKQQ